MTARTGADAAADRPVDPDAVTELAARLERLRAERAQARERVTDRGEAAVAAAADAYREATRLLDRYRESATGTGDFQAYVEFQERFAGLVEGLDDDLPAREAFETAAETVDRRRLRDRDFETAREELEPAADLRGLLERRDEAEERFRRVRHEARERLDAVDDRIETLERLARLGEADLDAPVDRLREPIRDYDETVRAAFDRYRAEASARALFDLLETTERYPLVTFRAPPRELREYVASAPAGAEPVDSLLEYAGYSASKLDHYVDDPGALRARVATHRTYLERLDGEPLTVGWPPPPAAELRHRCRELIAVVGRFAGGETVELVRTVRDLTREPDYGRLREAAEARTALTDDQRDRLRRGAVEAELAALGDARDELVAALSDDGS